MNNPYEGQITMLRAQIDNQTAEIKRLRKVLRGEAFKTPAAWKLTRQQQNLLGALLRANGEVVSFERLEWFLNVENCVYTKASIQITKFNLLKQLKRAGEFIDIRNAVAQGYYIQKNSCVYWRKKLGMDAAEAVGVK